MIRHFCGLTLFLSLWTSCVSTRSDNDAVPEARWSVGDYRVTFRAGPLSHEPGGPRFYSYYLVEKEIDPVTQRLVIPSAHSAGGFYSVTDSDPKNHIRLIGDPEGGRLIIEEDIPNDAGPCRNYALIETNASPLI